MYSAAEIRRKKRKLFEDVFVGKQYQYASYGFIKIVGTYFNFISTDSFCNPTGYHLRFKALFKDGKSIKFIVHITTELYKKFIKENIPIKIVFNPDNTEFHSSYEIIEMDLGEGFLEKL